MEAPKVTLDTTNGYGAIFSMEPTGEDGTDAQASPWDVLLGESEYMHHLKELLDKVASNTTSVLILGERGTGEKLVA